MCHPEAAEPPFVLARSRRAGMAAEDAEGSPNARHMACASWPRSFAVLRRQGRLRENREQRGRLRQASNDTRCHSERAVARVGEESPADGAGLDLRQGIPLPPAAPPSRNDRWGHSLLIGTRAVPLAQDDTSRFGPRTVQGLATQGSNSGLIQHPTLNISIRSSRAERCRHPPRRGVHGMTAWKYEAG